MKIISNPSSILPVLLFAAGCSLPVAVQDLYLTRSHSDELWDSFSTRPVRTMDLLGDRIDVMRFGTQDALEINCLRPVDVPTPFLPPIGVKEECEYKAFVVCRDLTKDQWGTFMRIASTRWYSDEYTGPTWYVQCMTHAELRAWAVSPAGTSVKVVERAAPAWKKLREGTAEEEGK